MLGNITHQKEHTRQPGPPPTIKGKEEDETTRELTKAQQSGRASKLVVPQEPEERGAEKERVMVHVDIYKRDK